MFGSLVAISVSSSTSLYFVVVYIVCLEQRDVKNEMHE